MLNVLEKRKHMMDLIREFTEVWIEQETFLHGENGPKDPKKQDEFEGMKREALYLQLCCMYYEMPDVMNAKSSEDLKRYADSLETKYREFANSNGQCGSAEAGIDAHKAESVIAISLVERAEELGCLE